MNKILVCSHGSLAKGLLSSLQIIMGNLNNIDALSFYENQEGVEDLKKLEKYLEENKENDLIVLSDLYGGSVNQEVIKKTEKYKNIRILENGISNEELNSVIEESKNQLMLVDLNPDKFEDDFDL